MTFCHSQVTLRTESAVCSIFPLFVYNYMNIFVYIDFSFELVAFWYYSVLLKVTPLFIVFV